MTRRQLFLDSALGGAALMLGPVVAQAVPSTKVGDEPRLPPLIKPKGRAIKVAFLISEPFQVIDFAGPWEIFSQVLDPDWNLPAFELYTVSRTKAPITASGGLKVVPEHSFSSAPTPDIVVVPAQDDHSEPVLAWLRKVSKQTQVTMSVCTGAFLLAEAGLLDGLEATTFHDAYKLMAVDHPKVKLKRKVRFVDNGHIATSSGLSAGIDLALHIVARYYGLALADETAATLEYLGYGWKNPNDTADLFPRLAAQRKGPICPVCDMGPVGKEVSCEYKGKNYYFCSEGCKKAFAKNPPKYLVNF